ncbi:MAG TPA: hypothetical protein VKQ32_14980 [Polyangia bacterium]|nr:hypothetical protein [Polyangia bacterium]
MDEAESASDHKALNALNEQIAAEQTRIADLERRIHVMDVELASWKVPMPPKASPSFASMAPRFLAFFAGALLTDLLGKLIVATVGR